MRTRKETFESRIGDINVEIKDNDLNITKGNSSITLDLENKLTPLDLNDFLNTLNVEEDVISDIQVWVVETHVFLNYVL